MCCPKLVRARYLELIPVSGILLRSTEWKSNANGNEPTIRLREMVLSSCRRSRAPARKLWLNRSLYKFRRAIRPANCAPDWTEFPKNTVKRSWSLTTCSRSCTPEAFWKSCEVLWRQIVGSIEPDWFKGIFQAIPEGIAQATTDRDKPVNIFGMLLRLLSKDSLRALAAGVDFLQALGRHLHSLESSSAAKKEL